MLVLALIFLTLMTASFVLSPIVRRVGAPVTDGPDLIAELRELYALRDVEYETIRDLEFDYHAGKIGESDYRDLSHRHKMEALRLVRRIDELEASLPARAGRPRARK
ncbi:MAG: hypothetical protein ACE5JH_06060 [Acidobacteriota bacterium]